jgi:hypothetical protein
MRVEFNRGVPNECVVWLWNNVGPGNLYRAGAEQIERKETDTWFYERVYSGRHPDDIRYVPTITVKDPKLATFFSLRWA